VLGLAAAGVAYPLLWVLLALSVAAYFLRLLLLNRNRGSFAVNSLVCVHRIALDLARLAGYLAGRIDRWRKPTYRSLR
jgi:hypothetical protein